MRLIAAIVWLLLVGPAYAGSASISWLNPTTRTDGSPLAASEIAGTVVEWSVCNTMGTFGTKLGDVFASGAATAITVNALPGGQTYCFRAFTRDTNGLQSEASGVASKWIPSSPPKPPMLTTIAVVAYESRWDGSRYVAGKQIGTVELGQPCTQPVTTAPGYAVIDPKLVKFSRKSKAQYILAQCAYV
jgi:hypothetical protein